MIEYSWINFSIYDLTDDIEEIYTKEKFEKMVDDKYVAMEIEETGKPKFIWTENYVFIILRYTRMMGQLAIVGSPRNPKFDVKVISQHFDDKPLQRYNKIFTDIIENNRE
jgi:hypothetical protein